MKNPSGKLAFAYATIANLEEKIARLEAVQPGPVAVSVVLPEREMYCQYRRGIIPSNRLEVEAYKDGWNACLDELKRLNPSL